MTEPKPDPEDFNVQCSEFSVQSSGAAGGAVFLSYVSQDAGAATRIAECACARAASGVVCSERTHGRVRLVPGGWRHRVRSTVRRKVDRYYQAEIR